MDFVFVLKTARVVPSPYGIKLLAWWEYLDSYNARRVAS